MRVAVIGLGSIGRRHVGNLLSLGCEVYGYDPHPSARARTLEQFPDIRVCVADLSATDPYEADAWVIATPWNRHLGFVEDAIKHRIPMFIEKPLGALMELPRWREIAAMDLPITQIGYQCRFHPKAQAMKLLFPEPEWGRFICCGRLDARYGPFLLEAVSHDIDLALWLGADADQLIHQGRWWSLQYKERDGYTRVWSIGTHDDLGAEVSFGSPEELGDEMYRAELAHFLDCVRENKPTICPLADGLRVLEVCQQVEQMTRQPA